MKRLSAFFALACAAIALPALAATYVQDGANMLSASTVSALDQRIGNFNAQTGKEIVVTVPSLNGTALADAAHQAYTQRNVNGVLIFIAKDDGGTSSSPTRPASRPAGSRETRWILSARRWNRSSRPRIMTAASPPQ